MTSIIKIVEGQTYTAITFMMRIKLDQALPTKIKIFSEFEIKQYLTKKNKKALKSN